MRLTSLDDRRGVDLGVASIPVDQKLRGQVGIEAAGRRVWVIRPQEHRLTAAVRPPETVQRDDRL
jgi:hypothetical protein